MKEFKVIQKMNNLLFKEDVTHFVKIYEKDPDSILRNACAYFTEEVRSLYYPSKSYCVAIIYAHLISFYFKESFWELLADKNLLNGNDDCFVPYYENPVLYDKILKSIGFDEKYRLNLSLPQVLATFTYFTDEFNVRPDDYLTSLYPSEDH